MEKSIKRKQIWLVLLPAMLLPVISSLFYFVFFSEYAIAKLIYGGTKLFTLIWPLLAIKLILRRPLLERFPERKVHTRAISLGIISGLIIVAIIFALLETPLNAVANSSAGAIRSKVIELGILKYYWSFALFLSFVHSLIEEYYWRWFVFGYLARVIVRPAAHFLAGISFAAHHVVVASQYFPFWLAVLLGGTVALGGIIWSLMYVRQGTLVGAWVSHIIVDLGILWVGWQLIN